MEHWNSTTFLRDLELSALSQSSCFEADAWIAST
jgi:hypothetical protein